jgi:hypothetical protein
VVSTARGSIRRTDEASMLHKSMQATRIASRPAGVAPASQYAASSAVRPCTCPSSPCWPSRSKKQVCHLSDEPGPAAAVLVDAQVRHRHRVLIQDRVSPRRERLIR